MTKKKIKNRTLGTCMFCGSLSELSKEHILPHWMRPYLPAYEGLDSEGKIFRRDPETGKEVQSETKLEKGTGEHRSQTLKVVCTPCNNGWMSDIVKDGKPAIEPLMLGHWEDLSEQVQRKIATWFALHNMVYERSWAHLQITPHADRQQFMADHDPGARRFMWIAKTVDDTAMPTFARFMGSGNPNSPSQKTMVIAAAVSKVALLSIYDPSHILKEEAIQKIEGLLNQLGVRIWPTTANAAPSPSALVANSLDEILKHVEKIIAGGESDLARLLPEAVKWATETIRRQMAEGQWPPKGV